MSPRAKAKPRARHLSAKEVAAEQQQQKLRDIRDILPRGGSGQGKIEHADCNERQSEARGIPRRIWFFTVVTDGITYGAEAIIQTPDWKPKVGDLVRFDRQPEGVADTYLHATLLEA